MTTRQIEEIFYFDENGITGLYNQIKLGRPDSFTMESGASRELTGSLKPEIGPGLFWTTVLAGLKFASELAQKRSRSEKTVESHTISAQERYSRLIDHLVGAGDLKRGLYAGWLNALARGGSSFCLAEADFLPEHVPSGDWIAEANHRQTLIVTDSEREYRMGMGYNNLGGVFGDELRRTSHTAIRLRGGARLRVFGRIEKAKYVKPYIVAWL